MNQNTQDTIIAIEEAIREYIQPGIAEHGGHITFRGYSEGIAYVSMGGACDGCSSIDATLEYGVELILKTCVPNVQKVELVKE